MHDANRSRQTTNTSGYQEGLGNEIKAGISQ